MTECPSDERLAQLATGRLGGDELAGLERHLDGCSTCRALLAVVSNGSAPYVAPERAALKVGERLGRYEIERLIAAGGMGMLYVAKDLQLHRRVALKLMRPSHGGAAGRARLLREAQAMAALSHPNVVQVYELGEHDGRVFVAMELLEGGTLREWMKRPVATWREQVKMFVQAGEGLWAAHQAGLVHRDFKPENVLVGTDGRPRVGDFGLSRPGVVAEEEPPRDAPMRVTLTGTMLGTPAYMSPEQLQGRPADARSDQYAFCVCLYEALSGQRPFPAETLEELRARVSGGMPPPPKDGLVPAHVWAAIARGLNPDPARRFPDMQALLTVLAVGEPARAKVRRGPWAAAAVGLAALTVVGGVASSLATREAPAPLPAVTPMAAEREPMAEERAAHPPLTWHEQLNLDVASQVVLDVPGVRGVAVDDPRVCEVKTVGDHEVLLVGVGAGVARLEVWTSDGERFSATVSVAKPVVENGTIELALGMQKVMTVPGLQRLAVGDAEVCDVKTLGNDQVVLLGSGRGQTTLLIWKQGGKRLSYTARVR